MARARVTQSMIAHRLGKSQAAVSRRLSGEVAFDVNELGAVAELLEVPVEYFLQAPAGSAS